TGVQIHGTTTSGDLELNQVSAEDLVLSAESGDIDCNVKYVPNTFAVKTSSGDAVIHFDLMGIKDDTINKVSPKYMSVATSSGDVTIKNTPEWLQVDVSDSKQFFTRGHNDSKEAAGWSVNTSSGDIGIIFSGAAGKE
ncbi:MAG: DUF4097 domain-containing protein, partial [Clostridiaceae bacterium]|nr:DUF4097 domain-containing protein [Clostridiaceae bacterium]